MNPFCGLIAWLAFQWVSNIQKCEPVPLYHILCCDATFGFWPELVIWPVVATLLESTDSYISILLVAINLLIQHLQPTDSVPSLALVDRHSPLLPF